MAHDVFISYSHHDKPQADAVCATLEEKGIRCWIAPRDVIPGQEWGEAIVDAIRSSRVMVLVFSSHANDSPQIRREVQLAVSAETVLIPFRIEDVAPARSLEYSLATPHWLDAMTPPFEAHLERLASAVATFVAVIEPVPQVVVEVHPRTTAHTPSHAAPDDQMGAESAARGKESTTSAGLPTHGVVDDLAQIGLAPLEDGDVPSHKMPKADRQTLSELAANRNVEEIVRRIDLLFEWADRRFASSGAASRINKPSAETPPTREIDQPELYIALQLAGRGLGWLQATSQLLPDVRPQLRAALGRAGRLFYRIGWLTSAGGYSTLGISRAFEDFADYMGNRHAETQNMLQSDSVDQARPVKTDKPR
jgi:hypothetical protein